MDEKYLEMADAQMHSSIEAGIKLARTSQTKPHDFDGFCTCGAEVPAERVALGRYNCTHCQTVLERRGKFFNVGG
jgi:hypothetical protein